MRSGLFTCAPRLFRRGKVTIFPVCRVETARTSRLSFHFMTTTFPFRLEIVCPFVSLAVVTSRGKNFLQFTSIRIPGSTSPPVHFLTPPSHNPHSWRKSVRGEIQPPAVQKCFTPLFCLSTPMIFSESLHANQCTPTSMQEKNSIQSS